MRIGFVIDYYKPHSIGGAERSTRELAAALVERGHDLSILTPNYGAAAVEDDGDVHIRRYWFPRGFEPGRRAPERWVRNPVYYRISARAIAKICREREVEILHAQNSLVQVPAYLAARRLGLPCVATIRDLGSLCAVGHLAAVGHDPEHSCARDYRRCVREFVAQYYPHASLGFRVRLRGDIFLKRLDVSRRQRILRRYSRIVFVSNGLRDVYLQYGFRVGADQASVIYNIPPDVAATENVADVPRDWNLPDDTPVIAYAGRVTLGKGADVLLAAIPRVIERHPEAVFVLAGRTSPQVRVPGGIPEKNIRCLGRIDSEQVHALLKRSALFVLPSVWPEPLSSSVLEALAFGVPVIGTRRGGTPEQIIDGENGRLVEAGDPDALADVIADTFDDPDALRRMSARCRTILKKRFDRTKIVDEMLALYESSIETGVRNRTR